MVLRQTKYIFSILFFFFSLSINAGVVDIPKSSTLSIKEMAEFAKNNADSVRDQLLIIQQWMSDSMIYDMEKLRLRQNSNIPSSPKSTAMEILESRKGVCEDFSLLFSAIANEMGINMNVVTGTTASGESHAWCVAVIDNKPYLFDPTWASGGFDKETKEYHKKMNANYFMAAPKQINHIPTDPLWQFSEHPLKYEQSMKGKSTDDIDNPYFNWRDSLTAYNAMDSLQKMESAFKRGMRNGIPNYSIASELACLAMRLTNLRGHSIYEELTQIVSQYESGRGKWSDENVVISTLLDYEVQLAGCMQILNDSKVYDNCYIKNTNDSLKNISNLKNEISQFRSKLEKQKKDREKRIEKQHKEDEKHRMNQQRNIQLFSF